MCIHGHSHFSIARKSFPVHFLESIFWLLFLLQYHTIFITSASLMIFWISYLELCFKYLPVLYFCKTKISGIRFGFHFGIHFVGLLLIWQRFWVLNKRCKFDSRLTHFLFFLHRIFHALRNCVFLTKQCIVTHNYWFCYVGGVSHPSFLPFYNT